MKLALLPKNEQAAKLLAKRIEVPGLPDQPEDMLAISTNVQAVSAHGGETGRGGLRQARDVLQGLAGPQLQQGARLRLPPPKHSEDLNAREVADDVDSPGALREGPGQNGCNFVNGEIGPRWEQPMRAPIPMPHTLHPIGQPLPDLLQN